MIISYLFSDLDIAFFALMYESELPQVVPDPISKFPLQKVENLQQDFFERQQYGGNLNIDGDDISLNGNLAKALAPIFNGDYALYHVDFSLSRNSEYDAGFYISDSLGVTLIQREKKKAYRIIWYPSIDLCYPDFLTGFSLKNIGPYASQPFKLCGEAAEMDKLLEFGHRKEVKKLTSYAEKNGMEPERLTEILKHLSDSNDAIIIDVGRSDNIKLGGIKAKLLPKRQEMFRFITSPDGDLEVFESFSNKNLMHQIMNFEGK